MSSNTTVEWNSLLSLGNSAPEGWGLEDFTDGMDDVLTNANKVIDVIEDLVNFVSPFLVAPTDITATIIREYSKPVLKVLRDSLSIGGGFIVIHPYNRTNRRLVNIFTEKTPFYIPAMTPREAFNELYSSFRNTKDPFRPQWTENINTAGVGLLMTALDVKGLVPLVQSFSKLIDMKEFKDIMDSYRSDMEKVYIEATRLGLRSPDKAPDFLTDAQKAEWNASIEKRRELQTKHALYVGATARQDISNIFTEWGGGRIQFDIGRAGGSRSYPALVHNSNLPRLHWWALNISNFTVLKKMVDRLEEIIETLLAFVEKNDKFIDNIIATLLKKVRALRNLVQSAYDMLEGIAISLNSTGIYAFAIPKTPAGQKGGVDYIISSLKSSLSNPQTDDAKAVASLLDDTNNTILFFAGASTSVNLDAWMDLFDKAFLNTKNSVKSYTERKALNFTVLPNLEGAVIPFNKGFTLRVLSAGSTNTTQLYYTYKITSNTGVVHSKNMDTNIFSAAQVNSSTFDIRFTNPSNVTSTVPYTLQVNVFNSVSSGWPDRATFKFQVSNVATLPDPAVAGEGGGELGGSDGDVGLSGGDSGEVGEASRSVGAGGTLAYIDPDSPTSKEVITTTSFSGTQFGFTDLPPFVSPVQVRLTTNDGYSLTFPIINNAGYNVQEVNLPIKTKYAFETYPSKLFLPMEGAIAYRIEGTDEWLYMTLPNYLTFEEGVGIEYMLYLLAGGNGNNNWQGPFNINLLDAEEGEVNVC
jgi:hypothetical protein